jgi:hypothetical protein
MTDPSIPSLPIAASGMMHTAVFDGTAIAVLRGRKQINHIPLTVMTRITLRPAGALVNGSIKIYFTGGLANEIVFTRSHNREFDQFNQVVSQALAGRPVPPEPLLPAPVRVGYQASSAERWMDRLMVANLGCMLVPMVILALIALVVCGVCGWSVLKDAF